MHRRFAPAAATAAVAVTLVPPLASSKSAVVIRLVSITTSNRVQDKAPQGASPGDKVFTTSRLQNAVAQLGRPKGAVVGSDRATLTIRGSDSVLVDGSATLRGGTIRFHGLITSANTTRIPVVGGTGRFAGARGTVTTAALSRNGLRASNVYRLTLP